MRTSKSDVQVLVVCDQQETESLWMHSLGQRSLHAIAARFDADPGQVTSLDACQLIIIDIQDQRERALAICRYARATFAGPVLLFTYEDDERFHIEAYRAGIDESIAKPIGNTLAVAKVCSWLRRTSELSPHSHSSAPRISPGQGLERGAAAESSFQIDATQRLLKTPEGKTAKLSKLECRLLSLLLENSGGIVSSSCATNQLWAKNPSRNLSRLKNLVYRLRKKIEPDPDHPRYLLTVSGYGYSFDAGTDRK